MYLKVIHLPSKNLQKPGDPPPPPPTHTHTHQNTSFTESELSSRISRQFIYEFPIRMNLYEWPTNPAPKPTRHWGLEKSYEWGRKN